MSAPVVGAEPARAPRGLPERLPQGERLLWQGAPSARALLLHTFHVRAMAVYFGLILAWCAATIIGHGGSAHAMQMSLLHRAMLAAVPFVLVLVYAWAIQRSTVYSITNRRVVISFGMALPVTFNVPFSRIEAAGLRLYEGGTGDIPLRLLPGEKMAYFVLWPHARPWHMAKAEPMLRCVADAAEASAILARALAENEAAAPARVVPFKPVRMPPMAGLRGRAVAAE
jgi:hypothetical protein